MEDEASRMGTLESLKSSLNDGSITMKMYYEEKEKLGLQNLARPSSQSNLNQFDEASSNSSIYSNSSSVSSLSSLCSNTSNNSSSSNGGYETLLQMRNYTRPPSRVASINSIHVHSLSEPKNPYAITLENARQQLETDFKSNNQANIPYNASQNTSHMDASIFKRSTNAKLCNIEKSNCVDESSRTSLSVFGSISEVLLFRSSSYSSSASNLALTMLDKNKGKSRSSMSFAKLTARAENIAFKIKLDKSLVIGTRIALLYKPDEFLDFSVAICGCFMAGMIAVPVVPSGSTLEQELAEVLFVLKETQSMVVLTTERTMKSFFKDHLQCTGSPPPTDLDWWKTNEFGSYHPPSKKQDNAYDFIPKLDKKSAAYIEFSKNSVGEFKGVVVTHENIMNQCILMKSIDQWKSDEVLMSFLEPRQQIGLLYGVFLSIFNGHHLIVGTEGICDSPLAWLKLVSKHKVSIAMMDPPQMLEVMQSLPKELEKSSKSIINISSLKKIFINSNLPHDFDVSNVFKPFGVSPNLRMVNIFSLNEFGGGIISFSDNVGFANENRRISLMLDRQEWNNNSVKIIGFSGDGKQETADMLSSKNSKFSKTSTIKVTESGFIAPGAEVLIIHPESGAILPRGKMGEIWLSNSLQSPQYPTQLWNSKKNVLDAIPLIFQLDTNASCELAPLRIDGAGTTSYLRTGFIGFVVDNESLPELHSNMSRLFVVGHIYDRIRQQINYTSHNSSAIPGDRVQNSGDYLYHITSEICESLMGGISGIDSCVIFTDYVNDVHLPIVLIETHKRPDSDLSEFATIISDFLKSYHNLRVYVISFVKNLPRLFSGDYLVNQKESEKRKSSKISALSSRSNVTIVAKLFESIDIRDKYIGKALDIGKTLDRVKHYPLDALKCKRNFLAGNLDIIFTWMNCNPTVVTNIANSDNVSLQNLSRKEYVFYPNSTESSPSMEVLPQKIGQVWGSTIPTPVTDQESQELNKSNLLSKNSKSSVDLSHFTSICHILIWRNEITPTLNAFTQVDFKGKELGKLSYQKLSKRIVNLAHFMAGKKITLNKYVLICIPYGLEFITALYACFYSGVIGIPLLPPDSTQMKQDLMIMQRILDMFSCSAILVNQTTEELLRGKIRHSLTIPPLLLNISKKNVPQTRKEMTLQDIFATWAKTDKKKQSKMSYAMIQVHVSEDMEIQCTKVSHQTLLEQCKIQAIHCQMLTSTLPGVEGLGKNNSSKFVRTPTKCCLLSSDHCFNGLGFIYGCLLNIYVGSQLIIIPPFDYYANPANWFNAIYKLNVKDAFVTESMLAQAVDMVKNIDSRQCSLHNLTNVMIQSRGRPNKTLRKNNIFPLIDKFWGRFSEYRLDKDALAVTYGSLINPMISSRGNTKTGTTSLWLDIKSMRSRKINILHETGPSDSESDGNLPAHLNHTSHLILHDSGQIPNNTVVAIVDPDTHQICSPEEYGEIWVSSSGNVDGFYAERNDNEPFQYSIDGMDSNVRFTRTGDYGFLYPVQGEEGIGEQLNISNHQVRTESSIEGINTGWDTLVMNGQPYEMVLFFIGRISDTLNINGLLQFPLDVELKIEKCYPNIVNESCVLIANGNSATAVLEVRDEGKIQQTILVIMSTVLEMFQFCLCEIAFVKKDRIPKSRHGEKQRSIVKKLHDGRCL